MPAPSPRPAPASGQFASVSPADQALATVVDLLGQYGYGFTIPAWDGDAYLRVSNALGVCDQPDDYRPRRRHLGISLVMAFALALSVVAATGTSIVLTARIILGMASYRTLPSALASVSRRFATPVSASVVTGVLVVAITWVYLLATITYYRRRLTTSFRDAITVGVLPVGAAVFLGWVLVKSSLSAPAAQNWSLLGVLVTGLALTAMARFGLRSVFFGLPRESDSPAAGIH